MKIWADRDYFYIGLWLNCIDQATADKLNLPLDTYREILYSNGATNVRACDSECWFLNREDAERALIDLEPYIIMVKLVD